METMDLLSKAVDSIINTKMDKYKSAIMLLINPNFNLFNYVQIAGSEAKKHYGFKLHEENSKTIRDLDVVIKFSMKGVEEMHNLFALLQETSNKLVTGYTGALSSIPVYYDAKTAKFKTALYSFAYPYKGQMRWVEVFESQETDWKSQISEFVPLSQLIACAKEWNREKDIFFLKQVFNLASGIELQETKEDKAYKEFLLIKEGDIEGYSKPTSFNINRLAELMGVERGKLQNALHEAHDVSWICPGSKILTVGEVKYLKRIFDKE